MFCGVYLLAASALAFLVRLTMLGSHVAADIARLCCSASLIEEGMQSLISATSAIIRMTGGPVGGAAVSWPRAPGFHSHLTVIYYPRQ